MEKIIIGRDTEDLKKYGDKGTAPIGKHIVGEGEDAHLTNFIAMDVTRPHVVLVCGKRGTGKSYSGGIVAEEIASLPKEIADNLSVIVIDTMGIYWSMKSPNEKERDLLKEWGMKPRAFDVKLFVPKAYEDEYEKSGIAYDGIFSLRCGELSPEDWVITFGFSMIDDYGIAIERVIKQMKKLKGENYSIPDIIKAVESDKRMEKSVSNALVNRFLAAADWNVFEEKGTSIKDLIKPGTVSIIDVSHYTEISAGWSVRGMLVGTLSRKVYHERLVARKAEERGIMTGEGSFNIPMVWVMIDEAHQFLPSDGKTAASGPLLTLVKEGREPGISLLFMTQRPNKLHEDALAQSDLIIAHRLTAKADIEALRSIMQTYMMEDIQDYINTLPRKKGVALILDDNSERLYTVQIRPRLSWHAGGSPIAMKEPGMLV